MSSLGVLSCEGHPQGVPLPIVFSRRFVLRRAPTRGAPTDCLLWALCPGEGAHKGRPYQLSSLGVMPWGGRPQGVPLPIVFSERYALGRAPTRGAPTNCLLWALCPGEGAHKGCPYQLSSLGVMPWGGHPQGVPLPIVFSRRFTLGRAHTRGALLPIVFSRCLALGRAPTRGAPTDCLLSAFCPTKGAHKGCPYRLSSLGVLSCEGHPQGAPLPIVFSRRFTLGRAPTRGAPTDCLLSAFGPAKGTHKGCPYQLSSLGVMPWGGRPQGAPLPIVFSGVMPWGGRPQGAPLPIVFSGRYALGRAPTRGAPTDCLLSALWPWEGRPQGAPLPIVFSGRYALGRAPTRGAPTNCLLWALCPEKGTHKGCPYRLSSLGVLPWEGRTQGVPLPIVFSRRFTPGEGAHKGRPYPLSSLGALPCEGHPQGVPLPIVFSRRLALRRVPTRGAPTRFRQPHEVFSNLMQLP